MNSQAEARKSPRQTLDDLRKSYRATGESGMARREDATATEPAGEIRFGGLPVWRPSTDRVAAPLSDPRWPLRLVLAWILHVGDAARVAEAYDEARRWRLSIEAREEWLEAFNTLQRALALGTVSATARRGQDGAAPIAAEEWDELRPVVSGSAVILRKDREPGARAYHNVRFDAAAIKAHWKPMSRARSASKTTIKTKTDAVRSLTAMMRADRENPIPKAKVRELARRPPRPAASKRWSILLSRTLDAAPDRAERREALIDEAWAGLPGWRS